MRMLAMILACVALSGCDSNGRYQIVLDAQSGVWRIDTRTGSVTLCDFWGETGKVACSDVNLDQTQGPQAFQRGQSGALQHM